MRHFLSLEGLQLQNTWLTIGTFDGVHRGHQEIARKLAVGAHSVAEEERREQAVLAELPSIYDFPLMGREVIDGRPALLYTFEPRPGYSPTTPEGRIIYHFSGQAWIDEADKALVTLRVDCRDSVSVKFGFIFRLLKGSRGQMERRKIDGEAWLPTYSRFTGSGRVFFIARVDLDQESEFSAYRRIEPGT